MVKLRSSLDIQFLELHREYLLLKQESCSIRVWNLLTNSSKKISKTRDFRPKAFIFFDQITEINNFTNFLTVSTDEINVWTCNNFGEVEIKFRISLPGIQTADCVNVCFSKGIIMTYCNGLIVNEFDQENDDTNNIRHLNENYNINENNSYMNMSGFIPQFIQASKYFTSFYGSNNSENSSSVIRSNNNISLSTTITGETISENEQEITNNTNHISMNNTNDSCQNQNHNFAFEINTSYSNQQDGLLAPFCPIIDDEIVFFSKNKTCLKKAIYIHSLYDGSSLGTISCDDINDESEDVVLLHYDSDGMEIACGTNYGLLRRYKHIFG